MEFGKTHNLILLIELCQKVNTDFQSLENAAVILTPYASAFRYPNELFESEPEKESVVEAIVLAEKVITFVISKLNINSP